MSLHSRLQSGSVALLLLLAACSGAGNPDALIAKAQTAIAKQDLKTAEIHLKNLLQNHPEHAQGRMMLARLSVAAQDERSAAKEWQRALDAGADPEMVLPELLSSLYGTANLTELLAAAARYPVKSDAARASVLYWTGQALWQQRKPDEARQRFNEAVALKNDHAPARLALIRMQMFQDATAAPKALDALLEQMPNMADALVLRAEYALAEGQTNPAEDLLRRATAAEPRHLQARIRLINLLTDRKDYKAAEAEYAQLAALAQHTIPARMVRVQLDYRQGQLDRAAEGIDFVLKGASDYPPALLLGAQIALARKELEKADQRARRVTELTKGSVAGARLQAAIALARNEPDAALQIARSRIDRGEEDAGLLALAGEAALRRNDLPAAMDYLNRATRSEPGNVGVRTALGVASLAAGNVQTGFNELERAVDLDVDSSRADLVLIGQRLQRGQWNEALAAIDRLEKKQPNQALAVNLRGTAQMAKGDLADARRSFEQALQREAGFFPAVANLVRLDLNEARSDDARKRLESFIKSNPKDVNGLLALAQLQQAQGAKAEDVTRLLRQAHEAAPTLPEALVALANQLTNQDKIGEALPVVQKAIAKNPEDLRLLDLLGSLYLRNKDHQQALDTFSKITRIKPDLASAHLRMGEVRSVIGDHSGALTSFRRAAELDARSSAAQFGIASALLREGRKDEALRLARKLQQDQPRSPAGLILEGDLLAADKQWKDAAAVFKRSLGIERTANGAIREHQALLKLGNAEQAESALRASLQASPEDLALRTYAGDLATRARQWKAAIEHYERVVRKDPGNPVARNNFAWALYMQNDPRAEEHARIAFKLAPLSGPIADTLGTVLLSKGQTQQALDFLRQAVLLSPKNADIRLNLLQALVQNDRKEEARKQAEQWLLDFPGSPRGDEVKALQGRLAG